jgi:ribosome-binding protein aMBF1 (putative translation factor)
MEVVLATVLVEQMMNPAINVKLVRNINLMRIERRKNRMTGQELNSLVGKNLRRCRKKRGWTQTKLAANTGIAMSCINQYETGKHMPNVGNLALLGYVLGVDVWMLFCNEGERQ